MCIRALIVHRNRLNQNETRGNPRIKFGLFYSTRQACIRKKRTNFDSVITSRVQKNVHDEWRGQAMKTEKRNSKTTSYLGLALAVVLSGAMMGCNEGYIGPDGAPLALLSASGEPVGAGPESGSEHSSHRRSSPRAYVQWHIPTAENYPSSEIAGRLDELPLDECYIVMCETGPRAQAVIVNVLEPNGYRCFMNYGASIRWPYGFVSRPRTRDLSRISFTPLTLTPGGTLHRVSPGLEIIETKRPCL